MNEQALWFGFRITTCLNNAINTMTNTPLGGDHPIQAEFECVE
jgi:hypothetical protein